MDNDSEPGGRARGREGAAQGARYGAHGPWPFVLYTVIIARFLWCLKLSCSVLRGELNRTPVTDGNVLTTYVATILSAVQMLVYPGLALIYKLCRKEFFPSPKHHFIVGFIWSLTNSITSLSIIADLAVAPDAMDPAQPGYTVASAGEYQAWRVVDLPVCAALHAATAVLLVVDGWTWLRYCHARKLETQKEIELRDRTRRWRLMFDRPEHRQPEHADMVTGVVERSHGREGDKTAGSIV